MSICRGVRLRQSGARDAEAAGGAVLARLRMPDLASHVQAECGRDERGDYLDLRLGARAMQAWTPGFDTLGLADALGLDPRAGQADLEREIVVALLAGPVAFEFPSVDELVSAVRVRCNIVHAARRTTLAFETEAAERPEDCWNYREDTGFTLKPEVSLIEALIKTTQPAVSGRTYSFSCYRATEYVTLLGIAQELVASNPALYERLQDLWRRRAIMSGEFHEVFLREHGSMEAPMPPLYYVPGDRVWFRNPDAASADATGFEGSWVMYKGGGLFTNFWKDKQPYTLARKCVEVYHWRHGLYHDARGDAHIDEVRIEPLIEDALRNPAELARIMALMTRYREPRGVYTEVGGCIDTTREFARWLRPGTADLVLPAP